jgi:hypothetical protein
MSASICQNYAIRDLLHVPRFQSAAEIPRLDAKTNCRLSLGFNQLTKHLFRGTKRIDLLLQPVVLIIYPTYRMITGLHRLTEPIDHLTISFHQMIMPINEFTRSVVQHTITLVWIVMRLVRM